MINGAETRIRTRDTRIFSPMLYLLSYLGATKKEEATIWKDNFLVKIFLLQSAYQISDIHQTGIYIKR